MTQQNVSRETLDNDNPLDDELDDDQQPDDEQLESDEQGDDEQGDDEQGDDEQGEDDERRETFNRDYVEQIRAKSARYRLRAKESKKQVEALQRQLHAEKVKRLDMVVDASEVPFSEEHLDDDDALETAINELLETKPYLKKRKAGGNIGQHSNSDNKGGFSLMDALRHNAG